jgi:uncharacterized protein YjiS (DUF1127 family)
MSTTYVARQTAAAKRPASSLFMSFRSWFAERRKRRELQAALSGLNDRELRDIGTTRGEIDYVAANRQIDPRGAARAAMDVRL